MNGIKLTPIDNGFYRVSRAVARALSVESRRPGDTVLPRHGRERLVNVNGVESWLARTIVFRYGARLGTRRVSVWSVRSASDASLVPFSTGPAYPAAPWLGSLR